MSGQMYEAPFNLAPYLDCYSASVLQSYTYGIIYTGYVPDGLGGWSDDEPLTGNLNLVEGTVTIDRNNTTRRTASSLTILPDEAGTLLPIVLPTLDGDNGFYSPYGNELWLYKGCILPDFSTTVAQLGVFSIGEVDVNDDGTGVSLIGTLSDRSDLISRLGFQAPYTTVSGRTVDQVINDILNFIYVSYGGSPFPQSLASSTYVIPISNYDVGDDPWTEMCDVAASAGMELFFDYSGTLILQTIPVPITDTVSCVTYAEGTPSAMTTLKRGVSNKNIGNVLSVTSQGAHVTTPVTVYWWDSDSTSETYYAAAPGGGFSPGPVSTLPGPDSTSTYPTTFSTSDTSLASTDVQAQAIVNALGLLSVGSIDNTVFTIRDQPAHDVDDVIGAQRVVAGIPGTTYYVMDQVQIDVTPKNPLQFTARPVPS